MPGRVGDRSPSRQGRGTPYLLSRQLAPPGSKVQPLVRSSISEGDSLLAPSRQRPFGSNVQPASTPLATRSRQRPLGSKVQPASPQRPASQLRTRRTGLGTSAAGASEGLAAAGQGAARARERTNTVERQRKLRIFCITSSFCGRVAGSRPIPRGRPCACRKGATS